VKQEGKVRGAANGIRASSKNAPPRETEIEAASSAGRSWSASEQSAIGRERNRRTTGAQVRHPLVSSDALQRVTSGEVHRREGRKLELSYILPGKQRRPVLEDEVGGDPVGQWPTFHDQTPVGEKSGLEKRRVHLGNWQRKASHGFRDATVLHLQPAKGREEGRKGKMSRILPPLLKVNRGGGKGQST